MQPESEILVKISKDDAGAISLTQVRQQRIAVRDLVELLVSVAGKDAPRIAAILERGTFVKGMSRLRWQGFAAAEAAAQCLAELPDPWPERPFLLGELRTMELANGRRTLPVAVEAARTRRWLQRRCFLDALQDALANHPPLYCRYDYEARADVYVWDPSPDGIAALQHASALLPGASLRRAVAEFPVQRVLLRCPRR
ncbi:MAG: hypothetical protein KIT83_06170 [Bryobacterales bacterium]|nr:hypothetical protein [Bryobacterales bacterium]